MRTLFLSLLVASWAWAERPSHSDNAGGSDAQTNSKGVLTTTITGAPANMLYDQLRYGNAKPNAVDLEMPKPVAKNGIACEWLEDHKEYLCKFDVDKTGKLLLSTKPAKGGTR